LVADIIFLSSFRLRTSPVKANRLDTLPKGEGFTFLILMTLPWCLCLYFDKIFGFVGATIDRPTVLDGL
jgi:hypothetical protein